MRTETPRLVLRDLTREDLPDLLALSSDPEVRRSNDYLPGDEASLRDWLEQSLSSGGHQWAIQLKATDAMIGWIGLELSDAGRVDFGYALQPAFWNQGYTTEAVQAMLEHSFTALGARLVTAYHLADNPASGRVMQKAGMRLYDEAMRDAGEGEIHYVLTAEDW